MKLFAFALREYDELGYLETCAEELGFEFGWTSEYPTLDNVDYVRGYDQLNIITNPMTPELLDAYWERGIRGLATRSIGVDHIDVAHAKALGMRVGHAAYPPEGVANYAIMLILMAQRKMKFVMQQAQAQDFGLQGKLGADISHSTVGVVGTGKIGETVVRHLQGFGCKIVCYDPYPKASLAGLATYVDLDELLATSDVVTLHVPGLPENRHIIGAAELAKAKPGFVLVNTARGMLVDTEALIDAIESGQVGGAALDTIEDEFNLYYQDRTGASLPNRNRAILMSYPNVIVSPHMAFYTAEDVEHMVRSTVSANLAFDAGEPSEFEV